MDFLAVLGIGLGVFTIIYFALRGLNITIAVPLAALIIILTNRMDIFSHLLGEDHSFMAGLADFIVENFALFLLGAILGGLMDKSNATVTISDFVLRLTGTENPYRVLLGIVFITSFLSYGGISSFIIVFALFPMVRPIFKMLDINWELVYIPFYLGGCTFVGSMLPGSPAVKNYIPTRALGTTLTAGADLGLLAFGVTLIFGLSYMAFALRRSLKRRETFYSYLDKGGKELDVGDKEEDVEEVFKPSIWRVVTPILTLLAVLLIFRRVEYIILIGLSVSILLASILFNKYIPSPLDSLNRSAGNAIGSVFGIACSIGFGTVLIAAPAFTILQKLIMSLPGSRLLSLAVLTSSLSGMMGTGIGPVGIVSNNFVQPYLEMGYHPEVLHRVITIAAGLFSCMPHTGMVISTNYFSGLGYKNGFKHAFIIVNGSHFLALITVLTAAPLLYS